MESDLLRRGFELGEFEVLPLQGVVRGPAGSRHLEPKVVEVLLCLAEVAGEVVEREEIARRVWGRIVVGDESITRCVSELRRALQDERKNPHYIQTLSKRGYRLLRTPGPLLGVEPSPSPVDISRAVPGFERPAIAVLPFDNLTRDPDQEYFADGITDEIITGLQRFRTFPVISRHSTFVYKARTRELPRIARELGVGYLVVGSVRKQREQVRLTVDLVDGGDFHSVWTLTYDLDLRDLFRIQEEVARSVVAVVEPEVQRAERARATPEELDLWDLVRKGVWHQYKLTRQDAEEARRLFERALQKDPNCVEALLQMSWWHFWDICTRRGPADGWEKMRRLAEEALKIDAHEARALYNIAVANMMQGDAPGARRTVQAAIAANPHHAWSYATLGTTYILDGKPEKSMEPIEIAMRLSPHDFFVFHAYGELAAAHHMLGHWDAAIEAAEHSLSLRSGYWYAHMLKTASLARAGRSSEAARALQTLTARRPHLTVRDIEWLPFVEKEKHWLRYFADGLRLAGWVPAEDRHARRRA